MPGIDPFAKELAEVTEAATKRAEELADTGIFEERIAQVLMWSYQDREALDLRVALDSDPQVVGWSLESLEIDDAWQLPDKYLLIKAKAEVELSIDFLIHRSDTHSARDDAVLIYVTDPDFNESQVAASSSVTATLDLEIVSDCDGSDVEINVLNIALAPVEIIHRALRGTGRAELWSALLPMLEAHRISEYQPEERIASSIDEITILSLREGGPFRLIELIESEGDQHTCQLAAELDADLQWVSFAPSTFDAEYFAGLTLNESSGAPILQGDESPAPLSVDFTAVWDEEHGWHEVEVNVLKLEDGEAKRRSERMSAEEEADVEPGHIEGGGR